MSGRATEQFRPFSFIIMKKILLSLVALVCATVSFAQNELVATLQHGDDVKMFYGSGALNEAISGAQNGDVIILSEGTFNGARIEKSLTIRGEGINKTRLIGEVRMNPTYWNESEMTTVVTKVRMECLSISRLGVYSAFECGQLALNKVQVSTFSAYPFRSDCAAWFENCIVNSFTSDIRSLGQTGNGICYFVNSKIGNVTKYCNMVMNNCTIYQTNAYQTSIEDLGRSRIINSIIWNNGSDEIEGKLPASTFVANTLAAGSYKEIFDNVAPEQNCQMVGMDVFEESNPDNDLTDEAKSTYLGTDGTPVGIFGGQLPFNMINPYPYISKMNVGAVTTADGKLSVEVEVSTAE